MRYLQLLLVFTFFTLSVAYSQRFVGSAILGMNATQVDGDNVYGFHKFGINGGGSVTFAFNEKQTWFGTIELLYTQKGSYRRSLVDSMKKPANVDDRFPYNRKIKYKLVLDYVEVPVVVHYEDPKTGWSFGAGFAWGRLVNIKEIENGYRLNTNMQSHKIYKTSDWSVLADVKFRLYKGLKLNFRYQYTFVPIRTRTFYYNTGETLVRKQYNHMLTLRLIYSFNEKFRENDKVNRRGERVGPKWVRDISRY